ncbi:hypothetical protein ACWD8L_39195 [Streptomyces sp. NPDC005133]
MHRPAVGVHTHVAGPGKFKFRGFACCLFGDAVQAVGVKTLDPVTGNRWAVSPAALRDPLRQGGGPCMKSADGQCRSRKHVGIAADRLISVRVPGNDQEPGSGLAMPGPDGREVMCLEVVAARVVVRGRTQGADLLQIDIRGWDAGAYDLAVDLIARCRLADCGGAAEPEHWDRGGGGGGTDGRCQRARDKTARLDCRGGAWPSADLLVDYPGHLGNGSPVGFHAHVFDVATVQRLGLGNGFIRQIGTPSSVDEPALELGGLGAQPAQRERGVREQFRVFAYLRGGVDIAGQDQALHPGRTEIGPHRSEIPSPESMGAALRFREEQADLVAVDKPCLDTHPTQLCEHLPADRGLPDTRRPTEPQHAQTVSPHPRDCSGPDQQSATEFRRMPGRIVNCCECGPTHSAKARSCVRVQWRISNQGTIMVCRQRVSVGRIYAG